MKTKEKKSAKLAPHSNEAALSLAASKLSGKLLFPEKVEKAKAYLNQIKFS